MIGRMPLLGVVDGAGDGWSRRIMLTEPGTCVMCRAGTRRGEHLSYEGELHEIAWCLRCWKKSDHHGHSPPLALVSVARTPESRRRCPGWR